MEFQKHISPELVSLFNRKPFQGQYPEKSKVVFLSSDANYSPEISNHYFFKTILEYQSDGVLFWEKYNVHHPFLLPHYPFNKNKDGVPFHRNFKKIGLTAKYASHVTFLELLDIPTIGNKSKNYELFYSLVSKTHLQYIDKLITCGGQKLFFVSSGVLQNMVKLKKVYQVFEWLEPKKNSKKQLSMVIGENKIQEIYHFSSWQIHDQVADIHFSIEQWLNNG